MMYGDDDMLMLSGIQHFRFCPRQWALIHIDQEWADNRLTAEGQILHRRVDDPFYRQKCGEFISLRAVNVASHKLGLYGITDVVELHQTDDAANSIRHPKYPGLWQPFPVEYKHGHPKSDEVDEVQLTAQAMCLEEQYGITIPVGAFFYAETRQRVEVVIGERLRSIVCECASQMHTLFQTGCLPPPTPGRHCGKCSIQDLCVPKLAKCARASHYLNEHLREETA